MKRYIFSKLLLVSSVFAGDVYQDNDFQLWVHGNVKKSIFPCMDLEFQTEFRFGDNATDLYQYFFQGQVVYKITDWFNIAPCYRQLFTKVSPDLKWNNTHSPLVDVNFLFCTGQIEVINRVRFQYLFNDRLRNAWLFRNRDTFIFSAIGKKICFRSLFSEEFFIVQHRDFFQNRVELGGMIPIGTQDS